MKVLARWRNHIASPNAHDFGDKSGLCYGRESELLRRRWRRSRGLTTRKGVKLFFCFGDLLRRMIICLISRGVRWIELVEVDHRENVKGKRILRNVF